MTSTNRPERVDIEGVLQRDAMQVKRGLVVFLSPWWHGPAHVGNAPLRVRIPLREQAPASGEQLKKGTPVRIACEHLEPPRAGASWWAATGSSPELRGPAAVYLPTTSGSDSSPVLHPAPTSGDSLGPVLRSVVVLDRRSCYRLSIERSAKADERARAVVRMLELEYPRIRDEVAARALVLYHDKWRGHRARLSRDKVMARIGISSVSVRVDGRVELCFSEGDLFYGHWIEVLLGADLSVHRVEVAGLQNIS